MKRTLVSLLLVALFFGGLQAKPVDVATAKSLGIKFMNTNTAIRTAPNPSWAIPPKAILPPNSPTD